MAQSTPPDSTTNSQAPAPRHSSDTSASRLPTLQKWDEGGTLQTKGALDWQRATPKNRLASCAALIRETAAKRKFIPEIQNGVESRDTLKKYAAELAAFIDNSTTQHRDPAHNQKIYESRRVSSLAALGMVSLGWVQ